MANGVLNPPNSHQFSDCVIGKVTQRSHCFSRGLHPEHVIGTDNHITTNQPISIQEPKGVESSPFLSYDVSDNELAALINKYKPQNPTDASNGTKSDKPQLRDGSYAASISAATKQGIELHRRRRREIQQQYRKRLKDRTTGLEADTFELQDEIQTLTMQHQLLLAGVPPKTTPWGVVVAYWDLFRNGLRQPNPSNATCVYTNFLRTVMAPNVSVNAGFGVDALLEDWKLLSLNLADLDICLTRMEYGDGGSLVAYARGITTITETMLLNEYPHLAHGDEKKTWSPIALNLLGRQLVVCTTTHFVWDPTTSRIVSVRYTADFVTPLLKLLGKWEDVAYMLSIPFTAQGSRRWPGHAYASHSQS